MHDLTPEQRAAIANNLRRTRAKRSDRYMLIGSDSGGYVYCFNRESGERVVRVEYNGKPVGWTPVEGGALISGQEFDAITRGSWAARGEPKGPLWVEVCLINGPTLDRILGREVMAS